LGLIENAIPYELEGETRLDFQDKGLVATILLPETLFETSGETLASPTIREHAQGIDKPVLESANQADIRLPRTVLVVEDNMMVAIDMSDMLKSQGVEHVVTMPTTQMALRYLERSKPDYAVLDISLKEGNSFEIARRLQTLSVPFCFATGYEIENVDLDEFEGVDVLTKPVALEHLKTIISGP